MWYIRHELDIKCVLNWTWMKIHFNLLLTIFLKCIFKFWDSRQPLISIHDATHLAETWSMHEIQEAVVQSEQTWLQAVIFQKSLVKLRTLRLSIFDRRQPFQCKKRICCDVHVFWSLSLSHYQGELSQWPILLAVLSYKFNKCLALRASSHRGCPLS